MYWMDSNSGNMRVINPSWLVINAQLLQAVEQAQIYKLRTDLSYSESLTIPHSDHAAHLDETTTQAVPN